MNPYLAILALLAVMGATVLATLVVENWRHLVTPAPLVPTADEVTSADDVATEPPEAATDAPHATTDPSTDPTTDAAARARAAAGVPEGALVVGHGHVLLRDHATVDVLCAVLFAGLGSTRRSGSDRAAAWVTASATPPSADPARFPPGVRLRGRTAKVAELLENRDGGRVWVTMQPDVDIARGLARTPELPPTLAGLVTWWRAVQDLPAVITPDHAADVAAAIDAIRPRTDDTAFGPVVGQLHDALLTAASDREPLVVAIGDGTTSDTSAGTYAERSAPERTVMPAPRRAAPTS
ncbi:MAG TPA: hypothetical protein PKA87_05380 [Microthrixaceae bacterium]|nr:hypothetical protein [Microthrixaceae bacterium]MCB9375451.1 hypothetical protein [Microthrixaceae bacterium]MCB9400336.1 hypothetical protein [Microthrixaceae bacterium]MCO5305767.1 hypothetical protein [Microthrixaceae bacterium]HMV74691.1 hypothetical protein [Microthrixaceae bacterium]